MQKLAEVYPNVPGLIGNKKIVQRLAEEIAVLANKKTTVAMEQGIYELKQVKKKWNGDEVFREVNSDEPNINRTVDIPILRRCESSYYERGSKTNGTYINY